MANKYYKPGVERAAKVSDLFGAIAPRYDLINDLQSFGLHRLWKRRLIRLAAPQPGERALDICCGTGDIALLLVRRGAEVVGLDFSEPMLAIARKRAETEFPKTRGEEGARRTTQFTPFSPRFVRGDAQHLPFLDNHFDIVTVGYGLRNLASWEEGLREMRRVSKPGGRLLVLDFGKPGNALWRGLYFSYLRLVAPALGKLFCGNSQAYAYILESLRSYPAQKGVALEMQRLNCQDVRAINLLGGVMSINYGRKPSGNRRVHSRDAGKH